MNFRFALIVVAALMALGASAADPPPAQAVTHRVAGLFAPEREADLRLAVKELPGVTLQSVDYEHARATFAYDGTKAATAKLDQALRLAGFGLRPPSTVPREKLTLIEIALPGLDCKGCCFAAYEALEKVDGVEQATAVLREGRVTALVDPARCNRAALEAALKAKRFVLPTPATTGATVPAK